MRVIIKEKFLKYICDHPSGQLFTFLIMSIPKFFLIRYSTNRPQSAQIIQVGLQNYFRVLLIRVVRSDIYLLLYIKYIKCNFPISTFINSFYFLQYAVFMFILFCLQIALVVWVFVERADFLKTMRDLVDTAWKENDSAKGYPMDALQISVSIFDFKF